MKYSVLSLFSGCGGLDIGFKKAGYHTVFATDIWDVACNTLRKNHIAVVIGCDDIRNIEFRKY